MKFEGLEKKRILYFPPNKPRPIFSFENEGFFILLRNKLSHL